MKGVSLAESQAKALPGDAGIGCRAWLIGFLNPVTHGSCPSLVTDAFECVTSAPRPLAGERPLPQKYPQRHFQGSAAVAPKLFAPYATKAARAKDVRTRAQHSIAQCHGPLSAVAAAVAAQSRCDLMPCDAVPPASPSPLPSTQGRRANGPPEPALARYPSMATPGRTKLSGTDPHACTAPPRQGSTPPSMLRASVGGACHTAGVLVRTPPAAALQAPQYREARLSSALQASCQTTAGDARLGVRPLASAYGERGRPRQACTASASVPRRITNEGHPTRDGGQGAAYWTGCERTALWAGCESWVLGYRLAEAACLGGDSAVRRRARPAGA